MNSHALEIKNHKYIYIQHLYELEYIYIYMYICKILVLQGGHLRINDNGGVCCQTYSKLWSEFQVTAYLRAAYPHILFCSSVIVYAEIISKDTIYQPQSV